MALLLQANELAFESKPVIKSNITENVRLSNKVRQKLDFICKEAKSDGKLSEIEDFMLHENKYIRCLTAMYCLFVNPEKAEEVLKEIILLPKPNPVGAQAFTILEVWQKGLLKL